MKRRITALVLCLMMILTMLPAPSFAAEASGTAGSAEVEIDAPAMEHTSQAAMNEAAESSGDESEEASGQHASEHASSAPKMAQADAPEGESTGDDPDGGDSQQADPSENPGLGDGEPKAGDEVVTDGSEDGEEPTPVPTEVADGELTEEPAPEVVEDVEQVTGEVVSAPTDEPPLIVEVIEDEPTEVLSVKLSRHEDDEAYTVAGEDIIFKVEITGGAAGEYGVTYRVEHAGDTVYDSENIEESEPSTKMVTEKISTTVSEGEFSYPASEVGVYRLTVTVADAEGAEAKDQLSFAVISPDPVYLCGKDEHEHTADCYAMVEVADNGPYGGMGIEEPGANGELTLKDAQLICKYPYEHKHDASCLPSCGKIAHRHVDECYNDEKELICGLEEHVHGEDCRKEGASGADAIEAPIYYCGLEEHKHSDACYDAEGNLICGLPEHEHTDACLEAPLSDAPADPTVPPTKTESLNGMEDSNDYNLDISFSNLHDAQGNYLADTHKAETGKTYYGNLDIVDNGYTTEDGDNTEYFFKPNTCYTYDLPKGMDTRKFDPKVHEETGEGGLVYYWRVVNNQIQFWFPENEEVPLEGVDVHFDLSFLFNETGHVDWLKDIDVDVSDPAPKDLVVNKHHDRDERLKSTNGRSKYRELWDVLKDEYAVSWEDDKPFPTGQDKVIYWEVDIEGGTKDQLKHITDQLFPENGTLGSDLDVYKKESFRGHSYTKEDKARGVLVYGIEPNPDGGEGTPHVWKLNAEYEGNSWSGDLTQEVTCLLCGGTFQPNGQWEFTLLYTSTIDEASEDNGITSYGNTVTVGEGSDQQYRFDRSRRRWGNIASSGILKTLEEEHTDPSGESIVEPDENGKYHYRVEVDIPRCTNTDDPVQNWVFIDHMYLWEQGVGSPALSDTPPYNTAKRTLYDAMAEAQNVKVTATGSSGKEYTVTLAHDDDINEDAGVYFNLQRYNADTDFVIACCDWGFAIRFVFWAKCECPEDTKSSTWGDNNFHADDVKYCTTWREEEDISFVFDIEIEADTVAKALEEYANSLPEQGVVKNGYLAGINTFDNNAGLGTRGTFKHPTSDDYVFEQSIVHIPYEPVLSKEMVEKPNEDNNYRAKYEIKINQDNLDLGKENVVIKDRMSGMTFIEDSVHVWETPKGGTEHELQPSEFDVVPGPGESEEAERAEGDPDTNYTFKVRIHKKEGATENTCKYRIQYQATVTTTSVTNIAWGKFLGQTVQDGGVDTVNVSSNGGMLSNQVRIHKTDAEQKDRVVPGAEYGLYLDANHTGAVETPMQRQKTDSNGDATFKSTHTSFLISPLLPAGDHPRRRLREESAEVLYHLLQQQDGRHLQEVRRSESKMRQPRRRHCPENHQERR